MAVPVIEAPPVIDGDLGDACWAGAAVIDSFVEVEPDEGAPYDPATEVLLMRDTRFLYVAFVCHEPEIGGLVLQDMHRDGIQWEDDAVKIALDTFRDGKSGYYFLVSAAGSRLDALVADNGQRLNFQWDGFWEGRALILPDRWTAEIAIPFKTMSFDSKGIWRANFERWRGVDRSRARWRGAELEFRVTTVSEGGELSGFTGLDQGMGIQFLPYMKVKRTRDHEPRSAHTLGDAGGEIEWQITPQLNTSLTFNTDFAETEADARQVNLTRFSLFFPEKRDFFLQDANQFNFGWEGVNGHGRPNLLPYFSRRIGLVGGEEIPIEVGARAAGRVGNVDLGVLAVRTGHDSSAGVPDGELFVFRPAWRMTSELTVGGILTSGDPESDDRNTVTGADMRFVDTDRLPGLFTLDAYVLRSSDETIHDQGSAYGARSSLETGEWEFELETLYTQDDFDPALGYVYRPGERHYQGTIAWEPRPGGGTVRNYGFSFTPALWTEPDGSIISKTLKTELIEVDWHSGDEFFLQHIVNSDRVDEDFEPVEGNVIPAGDYDWQTLQAGFSFSRSRPLSGGVTVETGGWYDGHVTRFSGGADWNPKPNLALRLDYSQNQIRLPGGNFTTRIETLGVDVDFNPDVRLQTLVQADNVSDNIGLQSRFRWIITDGRELFFVINSSWVEEEDGSIVPVEQDFAVKVVYAVRF